MPQYKVCVYAICKNEEQFVDRWMDSMGEADQVYVLDTGSTDGTVEKLRARGAVVQVEEIRPWRFDVARNRSLELVSQDTDICVCTDLDEVFAPGWRQALENAWTEQATAGNYLYNWSMKPDDTPDVQFYIRKIHTRDDYVWAYPVHEHIRYTGNKKEHIVQLPGVVLSHYPDKSKSRSSYLGLLELGVAEQPQDDRMAYYLGREYMYLQRWQDCIHQLQAYLKLPAAVWPEERCAAMRWIARAYDALENEQQAYAWYWRAIGEVPGWRDAYIECALMATRRKNWPIAFFMVEQALQIKQKSPVYVNSGNAWDHTPYDLGAICCSWLGLYSRALEYAERAVRMNPQDARLQSNLELIRQQHVAKHTAQKEI